MKSLLSLLLLLSLCGAVSAAPVPVRQQILTTNLVPLGSNGLFLVLSNGVPVWSNVISYAQVSNIVVSLVGTGSVTLANVSNIVASGPFIKNTNGFGTNTTILAALNLTNGNFYIGQSQTNPFVSPIAIENAAGALSGIYTYQYTWVTAFGESAPSGISEDANPSSQSIDVTGILTGPGYVTGRKVYRSRAGGTGYLYLVTNIANNVTTSFTDNKTDANLGETVTLVNRSSGGDFFLNGEPIGRIDTENVTWGIHAGASNRTSGQSVLLGAYAGGSMSAGSDGTVAAGAQSLQYLTNGAGNTAVGNRALRFLRYGQQNSAKATDSLGELIEGSFNTADGWDSLYAMRYGTNNSAFGRFAGERLYSGSNNVFLGAHAQPTKTTEVYITNRNGVVVVGAYAEAHTNYVGVLGGSDPGGSSPTNWYIGQGYTNASPGGYVLHASSGLGTDVKGGDATIAAGRGTGAGTPGKVQIAVSAAGASGATLQTLSTGVTVTATGVGIGTAAPAKMLHIQSTTINPILRISQGLVAGVDIYESQGVGDVYFDSLYDSSASKMFFRARGFGTATNVMTLVANGNVGIGTTTPIAPLHVSGGGRFEGIVTNAGIMPRTGGVEDIGTLAKGYNSAFFYRAVFIETNDDYSGAITLAAPAVVNSSYALVLPSDQGSAGQTLTNNGAGILGWGTPASGGSAGSATNIPGYMTLSNNVAVGDTTFTVLGTPPMGFGSRAALLAIRPYHTNCEVRAVLSKSGATFTTDFPFRLAHTAGEDILILPNFEIPVVLYAPPADFGVSDDWMALQRGLVERQSGATLVGGPDLSTRVFYCGQPLYFSDGSLKKFRVGAARSLWNTNNLVGTNSVFMHWMGNRSAFTAIASTNNIFYSGGLNYGAGKVISFNNPYGETLPGGIISGRIYLVKTVNDAAGTMTISEVATPSTELDITTDGAGYSWCNKTSFGKMSWDDVQIEVNVTNLGGVFLNIQQPGYTRNSRVDMNAGGNLPVRMFDLTGQMSVHYNLMLVPHIGSIADLNTNTIPLSIEGTSHTIDYITINGQGAACGVQVSGRDQKIGFLIAEQVNGPGIKILPAAKGFQLDMGYWSAPGTNTPFIDDLSAVSASYEIGIVYVSAGDRLIARDVTRGYTIGTFSDSTDADSSPVFFGYYQSTDYRGPQLKGRRALFNVNNNHQMTHIQECVMFNTSAASYTNTLPDATGWYGLEAEVVKQFAENTLTVEPYNYYTLTVTITNLPLGAGATNLVVYGVAHSWANASSATTILTNLVGLGPSATNLYNRFINFPITGVGVTMTGTNVVVFVGPRLSISANGNWCSIVTNWTSQTLDGVTTPFVLTAASENARFRSDGANWYRVRPASSGGSSVSAPISSVQYNSNSVQSGSAAFVFTNGLVGIGTNAPGATLEVFSSGNISSGGLFAFRNTNGVLLKDDGDMILKSGGSLSLDGAVSAAGNIFSGSSFWTQVGDVRIDAGRLYIGTNASSVATAEIFSTDPDGALKITSPHGAVLNVGTNGYVGIGTNTPKAYLHIRPTTPSTNVLRLDRTNGAPLFQFGSYPGFPDFATIWAGNVAQNGADSVFNSDATTTTLNAGTKTALATAGTIRFYANVNGLMAEADNTYDFGAVADKRFRDLFIARDIVAGDDITANDDVTVGGEMTATNGIASFATNIVASINAAGYTNSPTAPGTGTGVNMFVNISGTSGNYVFYNRSGVNGQTVCGTSLFTNQILTTGAVVPVPVNCGIQIVTGVGVTLQAYAQ